MKLYREVKASERLPESDCIRFVIDENGARFSDRFVQGKWYSYPIHPVKYWLEPIEITEEPQEAEEYAANHIQKNHYTSVLNELTIAWRCGFNAALSKLKGE